MFLGDFVGVVPIHVAWDVFSELQFRFRVSVGGAGGLPSRAQSVGVCFAGCFSSGNVSFDFP